MHIPPLPQNTKSTMTDHNSSMNPAELPLLRRSQQASKTYMIEEPDSVLADDYGECDISLQSYQRTSSGVDETIGMSKQEAKELLQGRLELFGLCSGEHLHVGSSGKFTFAAAGDHMIEVCIRDDNKAVILSTVVHKGKHGGLLADRKSHRSYCSYSLMTKMMKYNTFLLRSRGVAGGKPDTAGRIDVYDGTFVFFSNMSLSVLSSNGTLELLLDDFILKAVEISKDFAKVRDTTTTKLRRRLLVRSYDNVLFEDR